MSGFVRPHAGGARLHVLARARMAWSETATDKGLGTGYAERIRALSSIPNERQLPAAGRRDGRPVPAAAQCPGQGFMALTWPT